jgi:hypothetical protein
MADVKKHHHLRDRRDRLIDLLGLGETYPLRDLPVAVERLVVPKGTAAGIPILGSQRDCTYALWERETEQPAKRTKDGALVPAEEPGNGESILLLSANVSQDIAYRIRSTRQRPAPTDRWVYLLDVAEIKTGFNAKLDARVLSGDWLDPTIEKPTPADTRVVDYGTKVEVEVQYSQNGVKYRLVSIENGVEEILSESDVAGDFKTILLHTKPLFRNADIRIRVFRTVNVDGQPVVEQTLLDVVLPVVVRPSVDSSVSVEGAHILDHKQTATILIQNTQLDVVYRLYARRLETPDFLRQGAPEATSVEVTGEGQNVFTVQRPEHTSAWELLPGFDLKSEAVSGNGATLRMTATGTFDDDTLIQVRAEKTISRPGKDPIALNIPLRQVAVLLVRPNPAPLLRLQVLMAGNTTSGALRMIGGQPGVFYHLSSSAGGADLGRTGFFYERYGTNPDKNLGVGFLVMGRDLVVGRDPWTDLVNPELQGIESMATEVDLAISGPPADFDGLSSAQRATLLPELPIVDTGALPVGTTLHGRAVKARTALSAALTHTATITAGPVITAQANGPEGLVTAVIVTASQAGVTYSLRVNGVVKGSANGVNGQNLTFPLTEPAAPSSLSVAALRGQAPAIEVEEIARVVEAGGQSAAG